MWLLDTSDDTVLAHRGSTTSSNSHDTHGKKIDFYSLYYFVF